MKKLLLVLSVLLVPKIAHAHVKWFSQFSFSDKPLAIKEVLTPTFWVLMVLSLIAVGLLTFVNKTLDANKIMQRIIAWVEQYKKHSLTIMRAASAAVLLLSFQSNSLFVPELKVVHSSVGWISFFAAILLIFPRTIILSGITIIGLYIYGLSQFGWLHMLDYILFLGVGYYLCVSCYDNKKIKETGLIALYSTVGFSLCWVSMEKVLYPQWSLYLLEQNAQLTMGFDSHFFLLAASFVEFALGYLMIICLLQRPLAIVVTLVFFSTTLIFGKLEVIGHTLVHAALIVFILEGAGQAYKPPISFHNRLRLKIPFAMVNFIVVFFILLFSYQNLAMSQYDNSVNELRKDVGVDVTAYPNPPSLEIELIPDSGGGWNLNVVTKNFKFVPENAGLEHVYGEGHAHLYVDNKKAGRIYGSWSYLAALPIGEHKVRVTLNTNNHKIYLIDNKPVEKEVTLKVSKEMKMMRHDM